LRAADRYSAIALPDTMPMGKVRGVLFILAVLIAWPCEMAMAADPCAKGELSPATIVDGDKLLLKWSGIVSEDMAPAIAAAFEANKDRVKSVELSLHSCGGRVDYMASTIRVLRHVKTSHQLTAVVDRGATCASACIPIFLASDRRLAALSSLWFFHRSWRNQMTGGVDAVQTKVPGAISLEHFLDRYYASAGVSRTWLARMKDIIEKNGGYWQTGRDLWEQKSGIVTKTISDIQPRDDRPTYLAPAPGCTAMCRG
jgi:hypothetical protein